MLAAASNGRRRRMEGGADVTSVASTGEKRAAKEGGGFGSANFVKANLCFSYFFFISFTVFVL
ncbi:hypothetical protein HanRHA438_Chr13g0593111 [Helianthus annuus]|nr:hypothetical protein HanRHA438_Chr13g0593111 [Helianthus annuus]